MSGFAIGGLLFLVSYVVCDQPLYLISYANSEDSIVYPPALDLEGQALTFSAQLAVDLINNRSDVLPGYSLHLIKGDSGCIRYNYVSLFHDIVYNSRNVIGIVGPGCSESSLTLGRFIANTTTQFLSVGLSSTLMVENKHIPNSFSMLDSSRALASALLRIIQDKNWTRVLVVYDSTTDYYTKIFENLQAGLPSNTLQYMALHRSTFGFDQVGAEDTNCTDTPRIFIFMAGTDTLTNIMCYFKTVLPVITYPTYQFVVLGHTMGDIVTDTSFTFSTLTGNRLFVCNSSNIQKQLNGTIFLDYNLDTDSPDTISRLSHSQFMKLYINHIDTYNVNQSECDRLKPSYYAAPYFDAVWAQALAVNGTVSDRGWFNMSYGDPSLTSTIREHLLSLDFTGVSGRIRFNQTTHFISRNVDIYQVVNNSMIRLEYYDTMEDTLHVYGDIRVHYIRDRFKFISKKSWPIGVVLLTALVLLTSVVVFFQTLSIVYVKHPSIKATSPKVYHLSYIAWYILAIGCVLTTVANTFSFAIFSYHQCRLDHAATFLFFVGDVLLFGTLSAISYRIYRIFVHYMHPGRFIHDSYLIGFVLMETAVCVICNAIAYIFSSPMEGFKCVEINDDVMTVQNICMYEFTYFKIPLIIFPISLTVFACVFSIMGSSKITMKEFKTTFIIALCYVFYLNAGFWALFYIMNQTPLIPEFAPAVGSKLTLLCACILLLYLPPSWPILREWYQMLRLNGCTYVTRLTPVAKHTDKKRDRCKERNLELAEQPINKPFSLSSTSSYTMPNSPSSVTTMV